MRAPSALLVAALLLAGCGSGGEADPPVEPVAFDGDAAYAFVAGLVTDAQGQPRFRVPGTDGHAQGAAWLWDAMHVDGWSPRWQNFTGADYIGLDKGSAGAYYDSAGCTSEEKARLAGLAFHNLWAVHDEPGVDRLVLLGAHWESKRFANQDRDPALQDEPVLGANDGASGVGLLLQLMRHVAEHDVALPFDLGVAFFDGEDGFEDCHPLAGSLVFVDRLAPGEVDRFLLLDMVGSPDARFIREGASQECDPHVVDLLHQHAPAAGLAANFPGTRKSVSDDHIPFIEAGIPAVDLIDFGRTDTRFGFPPEWHTTHDTLAAIDAGMLGRVGDLVLAVLTDPAYDDVWPASC